MQKESSIFITFPFHEAFVQEEELSEDEIKEIHRIEEEMEQGEKVTLKDALKEI